MNLSPRYRAAGVAGLSVCFSILLTACNGGNSSNEPEGFQTLPLQEIGALSQQKETVFIDARSPDAFNGWLIHKGVSSEGQVSQKPGGHIPGAQLFSARWIDRGLDGLDQAWERTGVTPEQKVVIYSDNKKQAQTVGNWLVEEQKLASDHIRLLKATPKDLQEQLKQPLDYLPGFRTLVPPAYVAQTLKNNPDTKVIEIGWDGGKGKNYRAAHIPGALYWDDNQFEAPPIYEAFSVSEIRRSLAELGITKDTTVIVYSTESIGAGRGVNILKYAGVKDVVMLNGGIDGWRAAGFPVDSGWNEPVPVDDFGLHDQGDQTALIDVEQAEELRHQQNSALVSIRSWREYTGRTSGYDYFKKRGRIEGALWGHAGNSSWDMEHYHNPDHTMRNYHQIAEFWKGWNITPDMNLSFYCGNGWRAGEVWWYAQAMGYEHTSVFSSGWMRWREDNRPYVAGDTTREQAVDKWRSLTGTKPNIGSGTEHATVATH